LGSTSPAPAGHSRIFYGETTSQYFVTAVNQGGQSAPSNTVSATTGIDAPPGLQVSLNGSGLPALTWLGTSGAVSYIVQRATTSGGPYQTIGSVAASGQNQGYTDSKITAGTTYYYVIAAVDSRNNESVNSYQVSITAQ